MDFSKLMMEMDGLVKGGTSLMMPAELSLGEKAKLLAEQREDIVYLVSDLSEDDLRDFDDALTEAIKGILVCGSKLKPLIGMLKHLSEADHPEMHKLAGVVADLREQAADMAEVVKELKTATKAAIEV